MRYIDCTDCDFKGEVDPYSMASVDYCPSCGKELTEEDKS